MYNFILLVLLFLYIYIYFFSHKIYICSKDEIFHFNFLKSFLPFFIYLFRRNSRNIRILLQRKIYHCDRSPTRRKIMLCMQLKIIQRTIHGKNLVLFIFRKFEIHILVSNAPPLNFWLIYSPLMPRLHICESLARSRPLSRGFKRASWSMTDVESATFYYYVLDTVAYAFTTQIHTRREERKGGEKK